MGWIPPDVLGVRLRLVIETVLRFRGRGQIRNVCLRVCETFSKLYGVGLQPLLPFLAFNLGLRPRLV